MEIPRRSLSLVLLVGLLLFPSCEKPQAFKEAEKPGEEAISPAASPAPESLQAPATPLIPERADPVPAGEKPAVVDRAPAVEPVIEPEPDLSVRKEGTKILISGAMRSRLQVERIVETMTREFPDHSVEVDLEVDTDRVPVGWGNRISDGLLVPYFQRIKNPAISYHDTVVKLEGIAGSLPELRMVTEVAVEMFSGGNTSSIDNQLKVEARTNP